MPPRRARGAGAEPTLRAVSAFFRDRRIDTDHGLVQRYLDD